MAKGYPHKQSFNIKNIKPNSKRRAWYKLGSRNVIQQPKKRED